MAPRRHAALPAMLLTLCIAALPAAPVRADEPSTAEGEITAPAPEPPAMPAEPAPEAMADTSPAPPPLTAEPIEAVHRPGGIWGPVAVAADLLVMRPIGLVSLAAGSAAFVLVSPVAAATQTLGDRADTLLDRARNVFTRPLGAL